MRKSIRALAVFFTVAILLGSVLSPIAQGQTTASVSTVVTVLGPNYTPPPAISKDDINLYEGKTKKEVSSWEPAQGDKAALQLAIVIDDGTNSNIGLQFNDIKNFITNQPRTTAVGLFYASNGDVQPASQFSTDHDAVAKTLRLPFGNYGAYTSIYLSTMSLIKRWPATPGSRREILLIADGIDRFRGDPFSPDIQSTYETAEKAGVILHTLYASGVGRLTHNTFRVNYGQSNLAEITDKTGGESFFQGLQTPIAFEPFLKQLDMILKNQYWLGWNTARPTKGKGQLRQFRIKTELKNVEISAADSVWVPGPPK
ncbi:MAG: hypothetical protein WBQ31_15460 [Candidatus Acidiferrales bacterium]